MNSTLNMILALKLKFILIILVLGTGYFLENQSWHQGTDTPESEIEHGGNQVIAEKKTAAFEEPGLIMPEPNGPNTCTLGDLRLYIEL